MHQAKILWDRADYAELEKLFSRTMDYCSDNDTWKLNVAHVLYMQEDKYDQAARFYEPIVNSNYDQVGAMCCYVCTPHSQPHRPVLLDLGVPAPEG